MPEPAGLCNGRAIAGADLHRYNGCDGMERDMPETRADDIAVRVWFRMMRVEARLGAAVAERLREIALSVPQCDVLTTLTEEEGVSQQALARRLYVTKGNISGLLDRLESAGLVERRSTEADRRQYEIYLTQPGREAAVKAIAIQHSVIRATLGRMSVDDLASFERMLVSLRDIARETDTPPDMSTLPAAKTG